MEDKEKRREYNRRYYESHKADILATRRLYKSKPAKVNADAHRKASREYYHRKRASMTPEEIAELNANRRAKRKQEKVESASKDVDTHL